MLEQKKPKKEDEEILDEYIAATSQFIADDGEMMEEGAYTINGVPFCCGHELKLDKKGKTYICETCGTEYNAE